MPFTSESILLSLFTSIISAIGAYFGFNIKGNAELRAATEDLKLYVSNQTKIIEAIELKKLEVATEGTLAAETRKCIYSLAASLQSLFHSMCWLSWDATERQTVREKLAELYDFEVHKLQP